MLFSKLLQQLTAFAPEYYVELLDDGEVHTYQRLAPGVRFNPGVVYLGPLEALPQAEGPDAPPAGTPFLCWDNGCSADKTRRNLAVLGANTDPGALVQAIVDALADDNRLQTGIREMISVHNANKGLQQMVDDAYRILGNPLIVVDVSYKILAMCRGGFSGRPDIEEQRELGYMLADNVEDMKKDSIYEKLRETRYPHYSEQNRHHTAWANALVFMHGMEVGQVGLMEMNRKIDSTDLELLNFFTDLVSLELQKSDFFKANKGLMHSFFLSELLDGHIADSSVVNLRLQHLNWRPTQFMYVMVLMDKNPGMFDGKMNIIPQQVHDILPASRWAIYDQSIVFLLNMKDDSLMFMDEEGPLAEYLRVNSLVATLSSRFSDLLYMQKHYHQALKAYDLGRRLDNERTIYFYPDYVCHHIGAIVSERFDLSDFFHPAIAEILRYDEKHNTSLLRTLEQHLLHSDNPTLVAKNLFIHRNTLFYRIAKIKELFNLNLSDGDERLKIQLSLKFLELLNT